MMLRSIALGGLLATALACAGKAPATHYYTLQVPAPSPAAAAAPGAAADGLDVGVAAFHVDPPYDQDRIVFRVGADSPEIGFYAYHRWAAPLARMLPALVAERFRGARGIATIEPATPGRRYAARLDGRLTALEEVDVPGAQRIRLRMTLSLRDEAGTERWRGEVDATSDSAAREVPALVAAMGAALADALDRARADWERSMP